MAETWFKRQVGQLLSLGGRTLVGVVAVVVVVGGGGVVMGLSPILTVVLAAAVVLPAVAWLAGRSGRRGSDDAPGIVAVLGHFALVGIVVLALIQAVPYGREHSNPPVTGEPAWSSPRTRELMVNACYDCHSNEVVWPWYTNIAPISWAATEHVDAGRRAVNYSEFNTGGDHEADESIETIVEGSMPPYYYTPFGLHSQAVLSQTEIAELIAGLRATPGLAEDEREDEEDDD